MRWLGRVCVAVLLGGALSGCGGGGGGAAPAADSVGTATQVAVVYAGTGSEGTGLTREFLAISRSRGQSLYDLYALASATSLSGQPSALVYSGRLVAGVDGQAQVLDLRRMDGLGTVQAATASLSQVSAKGLQGVFDAGDPSRQSRVAAQAVAAAGDGIAGNWTGTWIDGGNSNTRYTISVATAPVADASIALAEVSNCAGIELVLGRYESASGVYPVQINYPSQATLCGARQGQRLNGVAVVYAVGAATRLALLAVDAAGSGISFRAER